MHIIAHCRRARRATLVAVSLLAFASPVAVEARVHHHHRHHLIRHAYAHGSYGAGGADYYTNVSGHHVHRPVRAASAPSGASARCGDGSWSFSEHHQGTCSHHGGVARWL